MKFDPTISLGALVAMVGIVIALISSAIGVIIKMSKGEEAFAALIQRVQELEKKQDKQGEAMTEFAKIVGGLEAQIKMVYEWMTRKRTARA